MYFTKSANLFLPYHDAVNENMSRRAVHKALIESAGLVAASVVQVYLMRRLFERRLGSSRV